MGFKSLSLFQQLIEEEKEIFDGTTPNAAKIQGELLKYATEVLSTIPKDLEEYTLHNIDHSIRVLKICEDLLPDSVKLNVIEITLLYYAVILHDIGMTCSNGEKEGIYSSNDFSKFKNKFEQGTDENEIFRNYLRDTHVLRSCDKVDNIFIDDTKLTFKFKTSNLSRFIKLLIKSHGMDPLDLTIENGYLHDQRIDNYSVNIQYLSILLRLGDILDLHPERAPLSLYWHIGIKNSYSQLKWKENQAVDGFSIKSDEIVFSAYCTDIKIERSLNQYIDLIDDELPKSLLVVKRSNVENYFLSLPDKVNRTQITNDGSYIFNDLKFEIDYDHVMRILMGTELYEQEEIFIRELIQNSYDAIRLREFILRKKGWDIPSPKIKISYDSTLSELTIEDNGIGIDEETLKNYVIEVGKSYYSSNDFLMKEVDFKPISKFGIGILSCFMVSESINIISKRLDENVGIDALLTLEDRYITLKPISYDIQYGTIIKLKLKDFIVKKIEEKELFTIIEENVNILEYPIVIEENKVETIFHNGKISYDKDYFNHFGPIEMVDVDNDYIEGFFVVCNQSQSNALTYKNKLSQQGFIVGGNVLVQQWLTPVLANINMKGEKTLTLKASRNKITQDEKYKEILEICTKSVVNHLDKILSNLKIEQKHPYLSNYLQHRFTLDYLFDFEIDFIAKHIPFLLFSNKNIELINFNRIPKNDNLKISIIPYHLVLTSVSGTNVFKQSFSDFMGLKLLEDEIVIIENEFNEYLLTLLKPYIKSQSLKVSSIQGYVYNSLVLDTSVDKEYINLKDIQKHGLEVTYEENIIDETTGNILFCSFFNRITYNFEPVHINRSTLLGELLYTNHHKNDISIFLKKFHGVLFNKIQNNPNLDKYSFVNKGTFSQRNIFNISELSIGIITSVEIEFINKIITELLNKLYIENKSSFLLDESSFPAWMIK